MQTKFFFPLYACCLFLFLLTTSSCSSDDSIKTEDDTLAVRFTNLTNGQTVRGIVNVSLQAEGPTSPDKIDLFLNEVLIETLTAMPYSFSWNTTTLTEGSYRLKAVATTTTGRQAQTSIQVVIQHADTPKALLTVQVPANFFGFNTRADKGYIILSDEQWGLIAWQELHNGNTLTLSSDTYGSGGFTVTEIYVYENADVTATSYLNVTPGAWALNDLWEPGTPRNSVRLSFNRFTSDVNYSVSSNANFTSYSQYCNTVVNDSDPFSRNIDLSVSPGQIYVSALINGKLTFRMFSDPAINTGGQYTIDLSRVNVADTTYQLKSEIINVPGLDTRVKLFGLVHAGDLKEAFVIGRYGQSLQTVGIFTPKPAANPFEDYFAVTTYTWQNCVIENAGFGRYDLGRLDVQASVTNESTTQLTLSATGIFDLFEMRFNLGEDVMFPDGNWKVVGPSVTNRFIRTPDLPAEVVEALPWGMDFSQIHPVDNIRLSDYTSLNGFTDVMTHFRNSPRGFTSLNQQHEKRLVDVYYRDNPQ